MKEEYAGDISKIKIYFNTPTYIMISHKSIDLVKIHYFGPISKKLKHNAYFNAFPFLLSTSPTVSLTKLFPSSLLQKPKYKQRLCYGK